MVFTYRGTRHEYPFTRVLALQGHSGSLHHPELAQMLLNQIGHWELDRDRIYGAAMDTVTTNRAALNLLSPFLCSCSKLLCFAHGLMNTGKKLDECLPCARVWIGRQS